MKIGLMGLAAKPIPSANGNVCAPNDLVHKLFEGIKARGHEVVLLTGDECGYGAEVVSAGLKTASAQYGQENENPVAFTSRRIEYDMILSTEAIKLYNEGKIDLVHCHDARFSPYLFYQSKTPVLYTIHGDMRLVATAYDFYRYKLLQQENFAFTCMSSENEKFCSEYGLNSVGFVPNGIDTNKFFPGNDERKGILMVGRMLKGKNITGAIEMAEKIGMEISLIGGAGPSLSDQEYFHELEEKYFSLPFVHYLGYKPNEELPEYYRKAQVMYYPTRSEEGMPLVILESMACGLPVVANDIGGIKDVIQDGRNGYLVNLDDVESVKEKINLAIKLDNNEVRKTIEENFTLDHMVDGYIKAYEKLLQQ